MPPRRTSSTSYTSSICSRLSITHRISSGSPGEPPLPLLAVSSVYEPRSACTAALAVLEGRRPACTMISARIANAEAHRAAAERLACELVVVFTALLLRMPVQNRSPLALHVAAHHD